MGVDICPEESLVVTIDSMEANGENLRAVLKGLNLSEYAELLEREDLDLDILAEDVEEEQLERIGVKTLGQRLKILGAAKKAETRSKTQSVEKPEAKLRGNSSQEQVERDDPTKTAVDGKPDEAKRKEAEERKLKENRDKSSVGKNNGKIDDKSETFLQNQKASLGGGGFSKTTLKDPPHPDQEWKSPFKSSSDDSGEDSCEGMSTTGGLLYTAAVTALKMMEAK